VSPSSLRPDSSPGTTLRLIHRLHFAFTITFHYLFPQLTMGLALLIVVLKSVALKTGSEQWDRAARFWGRIFAINFVIRRGDGHSHGVRVRHQLGTVLAALGRRDRAAAGDGRRVQLLSRVGISGAVSLWRRANLESGCTGFRR
jgi:hypothetical protein